MLNRSASLAMSTSVLKALPDKIDIQILSPSMIYMCTLACSEDPDEIPHNASFHQGCIQYLLIQKRASDIEIQRLFGHYNL